MDRKFLIFFTNMKLNRRWQSLGDIIISNKMYDVEKNTCVFGLKYTIYDTLLKPLAKIPEWYFSKRIKYEKNKLIYIKKSWIPYLYYWILDVFCVCVSNCQHKGTGTTGRIPSLMGVGVFLFPPVSEKNKKNSERIFPTSANGDWTGHLSSTSFERTISQSLVDLWIIKFLSYSINKNIQLYFAIIAILLDEKKTKDFLSRNPL